MISIHYVDDEKELLSLCKLFLEKNTDITVETCISAEDAITKIAATSYDAIVSDYQMPGMNGIEFLKEIRTRFGNIPYILFTGRGREDVVIEALNNGADFYLQKGCDNASQFTELQHMIHRAVAQRRADEALKTSLSQLHHAEKVAGLGHWTFHLDTHQVSTSQGARSIYGLEDREWTIPEVQQVPLQEYRTFLDEALKKLIEENKPYDVEFKIKRKSDGKIIDIHSIAEYDPTTKRVFGTIQDITRIKETDCELRIKNEELQGAYESISDSKKELISVVNKLTIQGEEIRERENILRNLSDNLPNGIVYQIVIEPDGKRQFKYISAGVQKIHGISAEEIFQDSSLLYNQVMKEDIPRLIEAEKQATKSMTPFTIEIRVRSPDDQVRWILLRSIPRKLPQGATIWDGFEIDISDQKRTEEALRESNELFLQFMHHSPIYIYIKTVTPTESRVLYASENYQEMIGIPGSKMVGKSMSELFPPEFASKFTADDWSVVSNGEILKLREDMNGRNYISIKFPIIQRNRTLLAGYTIDITDLKQTEESLHEANQKLRLLTGLTRHDIFNQITVIQGFLDLIQDTPDQTEKTKYLTRIRKASDQIMATIGFTREYEDFGTTYGGWQQMYSTIESAKAEVNLREITIENRIPENLEIYTDPIIRKVFSTLIENAIRHGETLTNIRFYCNETEHEMVIICEDNGTGIPDEEKVRIFDHGYGRNTGIGLFLAKEILSITGLSIRESGKFGIGARFEIIIPAKGYRFNNGKRE